MRFSQLHGNRTNLLHQHVFSLCHVRPVNEIVLLACVTEWPSVASVRVHQQNLQLTIAWLTKLHRLGLIDSTSRCGTQEHFASRYIDCPHNYVVGFLRLAEWNVCIRKALRCTQLTPTVSIFCRRDRNFIFSCENNIESLVTPTLTYWKTPGSEKSIICAFAVIFVLGSTITLLPYIPERKVITSNSWNLKRNYSSRYLQT